MKRSAPSSSGSKRGSSSHSSSRKRSAPSSSSASPWWQEKLDSRQAKYGKVRVYVAPKMGKGTPEEQKERVRCIVEHGRARGLTMVECTSWEDADVVYKARSAGLRMRDLPHAVVLSVYPEHDRLTDKMKLIETGKRAFYDVYGEADLFFSEVLPLSFVVDARQTSDQLMALTSHAALQTPAPLDRMRVARGGDEKWDAKALGDTWWMVKPADGFKGQHISMCTSAELPGVIQDKEGGGKKKRWVVQKYIEKPMLLASGHKYDIRAYVLLSSQGAFAHKELMLRVSPRPYDLQERDMAVHLTNVSIHGVTADTLRRGSEVPEFSDELYPVCMEFLRAKLAPLLTHAMRHRSWHKDIHEFQLFGVDLMVDVNKQCWLLEINTNPGSSNPQVWGDLVQMGCRASWASMLPVQASDCFVDISATYPNPPRDSSSSSMRKTVTRRGGTQPTQFWRVYADPKIDDKLPTAAFNRKRVLLAWCAHMRRREGLRLDVCFVDRWEDATVMWAAYTQGFVSGLPDRVQAVNMCRDHGSLTNKAKLLAALQEHKLTRLAPFAFVAAAAEAQTDAKQQLDAFSASAAHCSDAVGSDLWIVKGATSWGGANISIHSAEDIVSGKAPLPAGALVQKYVEQPKLIPRSGDTHAHTHIPSDTKAMDVSSTSSTSSSSPSSPSVAALQHKFDFRVYVLVLPTGTFWMHRSVFLRACPVPYAAGAFATQEELCAHLTNQHFHKVSDAFTVQALEGQHGEPEEAAYKEAIFAFLCEMAPLFRAQAQALPSWRQQSGKSSSQHHRQGGRSCPVGAFHVLGVDLMLDAQDRMWLLEVNANPDFFSHHTQGVLYTAHATLCVLNKREVDVRDSDLFTRVPATAQCPPPAPQASVMAAFAEKKQIKMYISGRSDEDQWKSKALKEIAQKEYGFSLALVKKWEDADILLKPTLAGISLSQLPALQVLGMIPQAGLLNDKYQIVHALDAVLYEHKKCAFDVLPYCFRLKDRGSADLSVARAHLDSCMVASRAFCDPDTFGEDLWMVKPIHGWGGEQIVVKRAAELPAYVAALGNPGNFVVQKYLEFPRLITDVAPNATDPTPQQFKWDLRIFVLVCREGVFLYEHMLIRTTPHAYDPTSTDGQIALTNVHLHGLNHFTSRRLDAENCDDPELVALRPSVVEFMRELCPLLTKSYSHLQTTEPGGAQRSIPTFHYYGLDVMCDRKDKWWLLEINDNAGGDMSVRYDMARLHAQCFWGSVESADNTGMLTRLCEMNPQ